MRSRPFLTFIAAVGLLIAGAVAFIQSSHFARILKKVAARYLPTDLGVEGDFSDLAIRMFPPGVSINSPKLLIRKRNIVDLPEGSKVVAKRIDLIFLPFQMFSGNIRVNRVVVVDGEVELDFGPDYFKKAPSPKKGLGLRIRWDELLKIRADQVALENTQLKLSWAQPRFSLSVKAESASVAQLRDALGPGYGLEISLVDLEGSFPQDWRLPPHVERLRAAARLSESGLAIREMSVLDRGINLRLSGAVKGDLLNPRGLMLDAETEFHGQAERLLELLGQNAGSLASLTAEVGFRGKLKGDLERPLETLRADGELALKRARFQSWAVDTLTLEGSWAAGPGGGDIAISRLVAQMPEGQRNARSPWLAGGKVEVGAFKLKLGSKEEISIPVKLERAHVHWLATPKIKPIYGLGLRASGPAQLGFKLSDPQTKRWSIRANVDLRIDDVQLDNQKQGEARPLTKILQIPMVSVKGGVLINARGVQAEGLQVQTPSGRTRLQVSGGVDFDQGWDLYASGPARLDDIGQLTEKDIRGEGALGVHVHGPVSAVAVDFDLDVKGAEYIALEFGDLKGRITYEDEPGLVLFRGIQASQGVSAYTGEGKVSLKAANSTIDMDVAMPNGTIQDLTRIFEHLTKDIWWYPRTLTGEVSGKVKVSGGLALSQLSVRAEFSGPNWQYLDEVFRSGSVVGGYNRGKYFVESLNTIKRQGKVTGRISYDQDARMEWQFESEDLRVSDFDHIATLDVPIRGKVRVFSKGEGKVGSIESLTQASLTDTAVRGAAMPRSELMIRTANGVAELRSTALGGQGTLEASYGFAPGSNSYIRGELRNLDFSPVLLLLNPRSIQDLALVGQISGSVDLTFHTGEFERASGRAELSRYLLSRSGARFQLAKPVSVRMDKGSFDLDDLAIVGNQGEAQLKLRGRAAALEGTISGSLDADIVEFLTPAISQADGVADLDFILGGTIKQPTIFGRATFSGISARIPSLDSPFENVNGSIQLRQNLVQVERMDADLAAGRASASGTVTLFADRYPKVDLRANLVNNKLKIYPFQYMKVSGQLKIVGEAPPYLVEGSITSDSALSREKVMNQGQGRLLKSAGYTPPPSSLTTSDYPRFALHIDVNAPQGILIQNDLFDAEMKAKITLINTIQAPRLLGVADFTQGKMKFKDREFQILSGTMKFDNPTVINPHFNLTALTDVSGVKIQLYASGRIDNQKIDFTSNPVLPESEIISLLALGLTSDQVRKLRSGDRSLFEQGEAASLLLHSLDFNRDVQSKTGVQIQLDEFVDDRTGSSVFSKKNDTDPAVSPKIVFKRKIGKRTEISVGSTVGVGGSSQREVNAAFQVTPGFSVDGVFEGSEAAEQNSYGIDLKLQKRFK